jgi:multiple sugar transport system permease protein
MALEDATVVRAKALERYGETGLTQHKRRIEWTHVAAWIVLLLGSLVMLAPVFWMVSTSLKLKAQIFHYPPVWIPDPFVWSNYSEAMTAVPFDRYAVNTFIICVANIAGVLISSSIAAYAFARLRFPGRDVLFVIVLTEFMLPPTVTLIPRYIEFRKLDMIDSWWPLILPNWFGNAFFIFLLRQFFRTIPRDLSDAAKVDGASEFRIFWQIILPLSRPALAVVVIFQFLYNWNDFLEPLIYINSPDNNTVALGLAQFRDLLSSEIGYLMAASTVMVLPVVVLFFVAQRYFIRGVVLTGMKG